MNIDNRKVKEIKAEVVALFSQGSTGEQIEDFRTLLIADGHVILERRPEGFLVGQQITEPE